MKKPTIHKLLTLVFALMALIVVSVTIYLFTDFGAVVMLFILSFFSVIEGWQNANFHNGLFSYPPIQIKSISAI